MAQQQETVLAFRELTRRFGGVIALNKFDMELTNGQILGLIGPNGSGKTTSFNVLTGIYEANGGSIEFLGQDPESLRSRRCPHVSAFAPVP